MSETNINFLKFSFEKAIEQHSTNISSLMKQFEQIITRAQEISEENTRLKRKVIILESNCDCPVQINKPARYKVNR